MVAATLRIVALEARSSRMQILLLSGKRLLGREHDGWISICLSARRAVWAVRPTSEVIAGTGSPAWASSAIRA